MNSLRTSLAALVVALGLSACGGNTEGNASAPTSEGGSASQITGGVGGATSVGGTGDTVQGGAESLLPCSEIPPYYYARDGSGCMNSGQRCVCADGRYTPECQATASCGDNLTWNFEPSHCPLPPAEVCPDNPLERNETLCLTEGQVCPLADPNFACHCVLSTSVDRYHDDSCSHYLPIWYCGEFANQQGCPEGVPEIGTPCNDEGLECGNGCFNQFARHCLNGEWVQGLPHGECL